MTTETSPRISSPKIVLFSTIVAALVVVVPLLLLEGFVRVVGWRTSDDPYLQFGRVSSFFVDEEINGVPHKVVASRELYRERDIRFPTKKPDGAFRIFFLGSSASAGWPLPPGEIYTAYLERALREAYPSRELEVINVSAHAYASYRVRLILQEVLDFEPDLLVVYAGNNDFLEPRRYSTTEKWYDGLARIANRSSVYRLVRGSVLGIRLFPENTLEAEQRAYNAYEVWSKVSQLPLSLKVDPLQLEKVTEHHEFSITSMVEVAEARNVPVILFTVPTNLRDWEPNVSVASHEDSEEWRAAYAAGRRALLHGTSTDAIEALSEAARIDPGHAETAFLLGKALESAGRLDEAYASYDRARNLDANPFRELSAFNSTTRRVAETHANTRLVDAESVFRRASHPYAPGFDHFLDYVHPNKSGGILLANAVFDAIVEGGYLGEAPVTGFRVIPGPDPEYQEAADQSMQWTLLVLLIMMHQHEGVVEKARLIETNPGGFEALGPENAEKARRALNLFTQLVEIERREIMTGTMPEGTDDLRAELETLYRDIFGRYERFQRELTQTQQIESR